MCVDVGVTLFRVLPDHSLELAGYTGCMLARDAVLEAALLPGQYVIQPICSGMRFRGSSDGDGDAVRGSSSC